MTTNRSENTKEQRARRKVAVIVACLMLGVALVPSIPYGYYLFMRWVVCGVCIYLTLQANELKRVNWAWTFGIAGAIYNPIIRVYATREIWVVVNIATIVVLITGLFKLNEGLLEDREEHGDGE